MGQFCPLSASHKLIKLIRILVFLAWMELIFMISQLLMPQFTETMLYNRKISTILRFILHGGEKKDRRGERKESHITWLSSILDACGSDVFSMFPIKAVWYCLLWKCISTTAWKKQQPRAVFWNNTKYLYIKYSDNLIVLKSFYYGDRL